ncbi:MAG: prephenate dehydrogenase/arogenate dehydrogenase family protein [Verrucomicrobia bacterium]|nr:prephenate dehydrogenase/arogenate dehydrogenase family protein [Verrucomicrobiota bacterium]
MYFPKVSLIGVGLLGGSLGLALKKRKLAARVEGYVRRDASIAECEALGVVDKASRDLAAVVRDADLVIFCTPLAQMRELAVQAVPHFKRDVLVTDVGSVKASVVADLEAPIARAGGVFIGSHPMAGSEQAGPKAARADLFENAVCVLTPNARGTPAALQQLEEFWQALGARTLRLSPEIHDDLVARCSHLPHTVAAELANYVLSPAHPKEQAMLCAAGFRDTTRIASGSTEMWRDIAMANREKLARVLGVFIEDLQELQLALERGDANAITEFFETAKQRRDNWLGTSGTSPE